MDTLGPIDILAIEFKGDQIKGAIMSELLDMIAKEIIRVIDLVMIKKDETGNVTAMELQELAPDNVLVTNPLLAPSAHARLIGLDDIEKACAQLENNTAGAVMLFENLWAVRFKQSLIDSGGRLIMQMRIPQDTIEKALSEIAPMPALEAGVAEAAVAPRVTLQQEPSAGSEMMAQLQELAQMHDSGILTDEEFAAAKQKLLNG
jgi:hypothetical protein